MRHVLIPVSLSQSRSLVFSVLCFVQICITYNYSLVPILPLCPSLSPLPVSHTLKPQQCHLPPHHSPSPRLPINPNNPNTPLNLPPPLLSLGFPPSFTPESRKQTRRSSAASPTNIAAALAIHRPACIAVVVVAVVVGLIVRPTASVQGA